MQDPAEVLSRLVVSPCYNLDPDLWSALEGIRAEDDVSRFTIRAGLQLIPRESRAAVRTTMLVIDSVTPLLKDLMMGSGSQGWLY